LERSQIRKRAKLATGELPALTSKERKGMTACDGTVLLDLVEELGAHAGYSILDACLLGKIAT